MKEIYLARIILAAIGLLMVLFALFVGAERTNKFTRMQTEQDDSYFEDYTFVMPDGTLINTKDFDVEVGQIEPVNEYIC